MTMELRNMTLYYVFVRNHGGSFRAVMEDIPRIRALGVDAVWLMPIHPIGQKARKGSLGSPYAAPLSPLREHNPDIFLRWPLRLQSLRTWLANPRARRRDGGAP